MEEERYWSLIAGAWSRVDGGELVATLARSEPPAAGAGEIVDRFRELVATIVALVGALSVEDARGMLARHRSCVQQLDREAIASAIGRWWIYDPTDEPLAVIDLFGEQFFRRVTSAPAAAGLLAGADGLATLGGWGVLARPVRARWRSAMLDEIPAQFAEVAYPGDSDVTSGDWATTQECRYFCGKDWRALDRSALHRRHADISFVSPRGLHYLLPAFLMAALEDETRDAVCGVAITESLLGKLSHGYMRACVSLMSVGQRACLADVLQFAHEHWEYGPLAGPDRALDVALAQLDSRTATRRPRRRR